MSQKSYSPAVVATAQAIDVSKLPYVSYDRKKSLPARGGIYFVGTDQEPTAYIGRSECLKTRFLSHHRREAFEQILEENGQGSVKIRYWQAPLMPKDQLLAFLIQLEDCLIRRLRTRINWTANSLPKMPSPYARRTFHGPIYVQLNQLSEYSVSSTEPGIGGFWFSAEKFSLAENAVRYGSPAFMISSGSWEDASFEYQEVKPQWKQYPTLYFLEESFRAHHIENIGNGGREDYMLWGNQATSHHVFLNDLEGFKEFSIKYLRTGLTNCSDSIFCETLLSLMRTPS